MKSRILGFLVLTSILLAGSLAVHGLIPGDGDGDGVADSVDACPAEDASFFDRDGDGCIDPTPGARHTEYWGIADTVVTYVINETGTPGVNDGSDFTALQNGMDAWPSIAGTDLVVVYGGTVAQQDAAILDQVNLVTFVDDEYPFPSSVLAVGITTSFTVDSLYNGRRYRPGEIVDADMIFNPVKNFTTSGAGGTDVQATATHEAGHLYGLSHSALITATMHYVLPPGTAARTLESDDELVFLKAYPSAATLAGANRITGSVTQGSTMNPLPGAVVYAVDVATGDTSATDFTLPDGSYTFLGLPDGAYYISIYPLNNSSVVNYLKPEYVNALVETTAVTLFVPEYWDLGESATDDAAVRDPVAVSGGSTAVADIITNIDSTPPSVSSVSPPSAEDSVRVDASMLIRFSEAINTGTISGNFTMEALTGPNAGNLIGGNAVVLNDDSVLAFTPSTPYDFASSYRLTLGTGLADKFGNTMTADFVTTFETEPEPPLSISSLAPNKGVVGNTVVINGSGFAWLPDANTVTFNGINAAISAASPNRLVVSVPAGTTTGPVVVSTEGENSNSLTFTVLSDVEIARGFDVGVSDLGSTPRTIAVKPGGDYAYVATADGASAVVTDAGQATFLDNTSIPVSGGLVDLDVTPDGRRVYGVGGDTGRLYVIDSDPADGALFNQVLASVPTGAEPLGIAVEPSGRRAYVATADSAIQVWDITLESVNYQRQIGALEAPDANLRGGMAVTPAGDRLLAVSGLGNLYVFDLGPDSLLATIAVGPDPHDVTVDPVGQRAYVSDRTGAVTVVSLSSLSYVQDITTGGASWGLTITPGGSWVYAANKQLNQIDVIDLHSENATFRTVAATIPHPLDPLDVEVSPDGFYAFSLVRDDQQLIATAIGLGPAVTSLSRRTGPPGAALVINGEGFFGGLVSVDFNGINAVPDRETGTSVIVTVPDSATSGPVRVAVDPSDGTPEPIQYSNAIYFDVLGPTPPGGIRLAARTAPAVVATGLTDALAISPLGDLALIGGSNGEVYHLDVDPASATFNQFLGTIAPLCCCVDDIAFSPDGRMAFAVSNECSNVNVFDTNQNSGNFQKMVGSIEGDSLFPWSNPRWVDISPSGEFGIAYDEAGFFAVFDLVVGSPTYFEVTQVIPFIGCSGFGISPDGMYAMVLDAGIPGIWVLILDPFSPFYLQLTGNLPFGGTPPPIPISVQFYADADSSMVLVADPLTGNRHIYRYDLRTPDNPFSMAPGGLNLAGSTSIAGDRIRLSPRGDRAITQITDDGYNYYDTGYIPFEALDNINMPDNLGQIEGEFTPDATRYYAAAVHSDSLTIFDFSTAQTIAIVSGSYQTGIVGQPLAAPLRVGVSTTSGQSLAGVAVTFKASAGFFDAGGSLVSTLVVATDGDGYAEADYVCGSTPGVQDVEAIASGLVGSPLLFITTAVEDPNTLPLQLSQVLPVPNAANVSVTTAVQATFSRGVDPVSIADSTLYLIPQGGAAPVQVVYGFADDNRKVSLVPVSPLDYGATYAVEYTGAITDASGAALVNPGSSSFVTQSPPAPYLLSIAPPSGTQLVTVVLSGGGFDPVPSANTVLFNDVTATPSSGDVNSLTVKVPLGASSGLVRVASAGDTTNAVAFNVLVPSTTTNDDVIGSVSTGSASKTVTLSPDGSIAYTVIPDGDVVIPIDVDSLSTYESISVGDNPVAIAINPAGKYAFVANFGSASLTIIDVDRDSPDFHDVASTLVVGPNPIDVAVMPDGSRVLVLNSGANTLSIVDGDTTSATHNTVIGTVSTGSASKTVTISPDGGVIYIGTDTGITILESLNYGVIGSVSTGSATKTVTVSPDGTLLFVVTTEGDVLIVDVEPGSPSSNSVIGSVSTGSATKTVTVSPDGGLLYLVQEGTDEVIVVSIETVGAASVIEAPVVLPPKSVIVAFVDTIQTSDDPDFLVFDPTGSGLFVIGTGGDQKLTFYGESAPPVPAELEVFPRVLVIFEGDDDLRAWPFRYIRAWIELPAGYDPRDIDLASVRMNETVPALDYNRITDIDHDGLEELKIRFDRVPFQQALPVGWVVPVRIGGSVGGELFLGETTITTIRPGVTLPRPWDHLPPGQVTKIRWNSPPGYDIDAVDVKWTFDDGETWQTIAEGIPDNGSVDWLTPNRRYDEARVLVTLYSGGSDIGSGMSEVPFSITSPLAVTLASFETAVEDGAAVLRWTTALEIGTRGFYVLRSEAENGLYERVSHQLIEANGGASGGRYEFRDESVQPNREYFYKLQEVPQEGPGSEHGPYRVIYRLTFALEQNVPNPFNPVTTIRFSIAGDSQVRLVVYDVAGRKVRTLVDGLKTADVYRVSWDGTNDAGQPVATGVYFYRLTAGKFVQTHKMLILK